MIAVVLGSIQQTMSTDIAGFIRVVNEISHNTTTINEQFYNFIKTSELQQWKKEDWALPIKCNAMAIQTSVSKPCSLNHIL